MSRRRMQPVLPTQEMAIKCESDSFDRCRQHLAYVSTQHTSAHSKGTLISEEQTSKELLPQRTLTVWGITTVRLASSFTGLDSTASLHTKNLFIVKLETSDPSPNCECSLIMPSTKVWHSTLFLSEGALHYL